LSGLKGHNIHSLGGVSPIQDKAKDAREIIIEAGREIFARYGFKKTTMDDIARAAHKGKSSLYHYFKSKEEVFGAVVEKEASELKAELSRAISLEKAPQGKLRAYLVTRMEAFRRFANLYSAFQEEYPESGQFLGEFRERYDQYELALYKEILQEGIHRGVFEIRDLDLTAYAMVIAAKGLEYHWAMEKNPRNMERNMDSLLEVFFNGILKR
jgi:AcrR family transcriptional regulator